MKKWLQRIVVIFVAFITFGIISPNHEIWDLLESDHSTDSKSELTENTDLNNSIVDYDDKHANVDERLVEILAVAKEQSYIKFGARIAPVISEEFDERIFPKMQEVLESELSDLKLTRYISITEQPSGDYSEKIFHISDGTNGKDLIRFHVRTEKRPLEGYYYNFHYHTYEDRFVAHHDIGDIYWSKNTPPKWLS